MTNLARENISLSIARGERLDELEVRAQELESSSNEFHQGARRVRRLMCVRSWKMLCAVLLVAAVLVIIVAVSVAATLKK